MDGRDTKHGNVKEEGSRRYYRKNWDEGNKMIRVCTKNGRKDNRYTIGNPIRGGKEEG